MVTATITQWVVWFVLKAVEINMALEGVRHEVRTAFKHNRNVWGSRRGGGAKCILGTGASQEFVTHENQQQHYIIYVTS